MPLNQTFTVGLFWSSRTGDTRFNKPIFMQQTQPKDNFSLTRSKIKKGERRTIQPVGTSINNSFVGERVFYHLNERFESNITGDIIFFGTLQTFRNRLAVVCRIKELFLEEKTTKCERRASETLINNYLAKERAFYRLNERFVSNITGNIIFWTRSSERFKQ